MLPLLRLLQDGRFHSGEALGAALGVSRSAIWKQLQALYPPYDDYQKAAKGREIPVVVLDPIK